MPEFTNMRSLLTALAQAMNLINPDMEHHHEQTAYLAFQIGYEMGLRDDDLYYAVYGALLHDIGAVLFKEQQSVESIEENEREIAKLGARMIRDLEGFEAIADIIEGSQNTYSEDLDAISDEEYDACEMTEAEISTCMDIAQAIHLADFVATMMDEKEHILNQVKRINAAVKLGRGTEFSPKSVDAFMRVSSREFVWMDVALNPSFLLIFTGDIRPVSLEEAVRLTHFMSRIIDFRSPFTAMHSAGVAASAKTLARLAGMNDEECKMMEIAGYLHDVGKLRVPNEILEKPGKLTEEEFNIVKEHPYYTRLILKDVDGFERIANWAGFHHEKLNGNGYPFHFDAEMLDTGARIMAVADIFSAITEVRPYRAGMSRERALAVMRENVVAGGISGEIVGLLEQHYDVIDEARERESREAGKRYFESLEREMAG